MIPQNIAHYRILSKLGEGGMGAVYRAVDEKLGREVAVKVLPDLFAQDPDRLARFTREAQVLASLNHPNIAAIYGVEDRALVMELVEGPHIAGPQPEEKVLRLATELIDALAYAHEKGIVHRDLKPANLKLAADGRLKVLDFGLAKALSADPAPSDPAISPTLTMRATAAGMILGTAAYMSPEQARGHTVDKRADIWSFGVIVYELLTGLQLFAGETLSDTLAAVLKTDPDLTAVPLRFRRLLQLCLARDPRDRLRDISGALLLLEERPAQNPIAPPAASRRNVILGGIAGFAAAALPGVWLGARLHPSPSAAPVRFQLSIFDKVTFPLAAIFEFSPDGSRLAFTSPITGESALWVRPMDSLEAKRLMGAEGAAYPIWSPDGAQLAFFADGKLKRMPSSGGPVQVICEAAAGRGGCWTPGGLIIFSPSSRSMLHRVPASGGQPVPIIAAAPGAASDQDYDRYPTSIAGTEDFLYCHFSVDRERAGVYLGSAAGKAPTRVLPDLTQAYFVGETRARAGWIVFCRDSAVLAQRFRPADGGLSEDPAQIASDVGSSGNTGRKGFSLSANGALATWAGPNRWLRRVVAVDRKGSRIGVVAEVSSGGLPVGVNVNTFAWSPDVSRLALTINSGAAGSDIWVLSTPAGEPTRITLTGHAESFLWSADGRSIVYSDRPSLPITRIYRRAVEGAGIGEFVREDKHQASLLDWSLDGKYMVYGTLGAELDAFFVQPMDYTGSVPEPHRLSYRGMLSGARISPDGRWIAFSASERGSDRIFVQPFPSGGPTREIVSNGSSPSWTKAGKELVYLSSSRKLMAMPIGAADGGLRAGTPEILFDLPYENNFFVTRDGSRFLFRTPLDGAAALPPVEVVTDWRSAIGRS